MAKNFEHHACYLTVRIATTTNQGVSSIGTGFLYQLHYPNCDHSSVLLISNRHVLSDPTGSVSITFNRKGKEGSPDFGNTNSFVYRNFSDLYCSHPDPNVDLACLNITGITDKDIFYKTLTDPFLQTIDFEKIPPSTIVQFVGYPDGKFDTVNNLPLIRTGSIASLPEVDFNGRAHIVIDAQVFQGSSGSPVFVAIDSTYKLLGVVSETMVRHNQLQTISAGLSVGVQEILGLGLVIKQSKVKELIEFVENKFRPTIITVGPKS